MPPSETITFGPSTDSWTYTPESRVYSLVRNSSQPPFVFGTTQGAPDISVAVAPELTALVVVDMQNYFLHPSCMDHPAGLAAVDPLLEVVGRCREVGIKIIWLNWGLEETDLPTIPAATVHSFSGGFTSPPTTAGSPPRRATFGDDMGSDRGRLLMKGSWNAELYGPLSASASASAAQSQSQSQSQSSSGDIFVSKDRVSGFWRGDTNLAKALSEHGIKTLLFAGVNTNQCVLGTLLDAYFRGFDCVMLDDCCGTTTPGAQEVVGLDVSRLYGFVTDSATFKKGKMDS